MMTQPRKLTHFVYQVLQSVSRGREKGKTLVELGQEFTHDQKSLYHFVASLTDLELVYVKRASSVGVY
jgi:hypothetical protein